MIQHTFLKPCLVNLISKDTNLRVAKAREKFWKMKKKISRSGNSIFSQGNLEKLKKVREF